jgi:NAD+ diphosphatase
MRRPNPYAEIGLDRASARRRDEAWIRSLLEAGTAAILPVWRTKNLVIPGAEPCASLLRCDEARAFIEDNGALVFLGLRGEVAHFAVDVSHLDEPAAHPTLAARGEFVELRTVGSLLPRAEGGLLAYARGILHWHATHKFCGACGAPTVAREAGHLRVCSACNSQHFPRTDPAVIMLVHSGDRAVLGRKSEWPEGMYSTLAGFVEPGESLEDAVAREVAEEVGIGVRNVRYHSSQPWPFPASLMLGFYAEAESEAIARNADELEDARWFTRAELSEGGAGIARRPRSDSIARRLIEDWIADPSA